LGCTHSGGASVQECERFALVRRRDVDGHGQRIAGSFASRQRGEECGHNEE
jgi:hypothetical protein